MNKITTCILFSLFSLPAFANQLEFYLPKGEMYDATIPSPEAVLGQQLGKQHLRHDQLISYLSILASGRNEAKLIDYGKTNEGRRLVLLAISSADNIKNIESVKNNPDILKVWNGFSIHGNESSGANASVLYAWYLLASNNKTIKEALKNTVVLIDPSINPDGLSRFTTYVNNNRSLTTVTDPNDISHLEHWPSGRTNHYWFDLNRDWLLLTQPESKARIKQFHEWQPHVLTDHHEMGSASTFFFQPGIPSRKNPLISHTNIELTNELAQFHAEALDQVGQHYYSEESFDDFYPGKGSTYPDLHGSIGILFEQSRANGGVMDTHNGQRSLAIGIRNQFLTALSTLKGSQHNRDKLIDYKKGFFKAAMEQAEKLSAKGYLLDVSDNPFTANKLQEFLSMHQIRFTNLAADKTIDKHKFHKDQAIYISLNQPQTTLIQSLFNTDTSFKDNTFYDVSAWHIGMAWGLPWAEVTSNISTNDTLLPNKPKNNYNKDAIAYIFDWHTGNAPAALNYLSQNKYNVLLTAKPLNIDNHQVPAGSFILPVSDKNNQDQIFSVLSTITDAFQVKWHPLTTGLADSGVDLGSPAVQKVKENHVMMLVGDGVDAYQAGSLWHLFDTQVYMPLTKVRTHDFNRINLSKYTHIILPNGNYNKYFNEQSVAQLNNWVSAGGHLIALQSAATWVENTLQKPANETEKSTGTKDDEALVRKAYGDYEKDAAEKVLGGAIVAANADLTHPLSFGTNLNTQYVMMKGRAVLKPSLHAYDTPLQVTESVRAAGYISEYWHEKLSKAPLVLAEKKGRGSIIKFGFNPNFRAFWYGTQRWMINAVFMADLIRNTK